MENLSKDLFFEVLLRLPHKSISLCSCVSRSWRATTQDPVFVKAHITRWARFHDRSPTQLLITIPKDKKAYTVNLDGGGDQQGDDEDNDSNTTTLSLKITPIGTTFQHWKFVNGSHNGLLYIQDLVRERDIHVWDPMCGGAPLALPEDKTFQAIMIGIGYDNSTTRRYKFLRVGIKRITNIFDPNAIHPVKECHICDINVDGTVGPWRSIGVFYNNKYDARFRGVTWNGGIHWLVYKRGRINIGRPRLASFCIEEEKFKTCKLPFCLREHSYDRVYSLLVLGGRLSIIDHSITSLRMVIWMVKDDFVHHRYTWTKEYVIPFDKHPNMNESGFMIKCLWRDGEILMTKDHNSLVSYDTKKGTFQDVHIHGLKGIHYIEVYPFWKSFMLKRADDTKLEETERKAKRLKINTQS